RCAEAPNEYMQKPAPGVQTRAGFLLAHYSTGTLMRCRSAGAAHPSTRPASRCAAGGRSRARASDRPARRGLVPPGALPSRVERRDAVVRHHRAVAGRLMVRRRDWPGAAPQRGHARADRPLNSAPPPAAARGAADPQPWGLFLLSAKSRSEQLLKKLLDIILEVVSEKQTKA